jgi:FADH2-dependent halogenase
MKTDVAIVGGGPGGSSAAMFLAQKGVRSTIIEKAKFPRYHIGESMTGECKRILDVLGLDARMYSLRHPIKHGVKVYSPNGVGTFWVPVMARCPERGLIKQTTWQVRRSDFDVMMLNEAGSRGANVIEAEATEPLVDGDEVRGVRIRRQDGSTDRVESKVVIDATGQHTFLARCGVTSVKERGRYDKQVAIFSQVVGAIRDSGTDGDTSRDNTLIFYQKKFHWAWFIPLDEETVSVGVVVPVDYFMARKETKHDFLVRELRELNAELSRRLPEIKLTEEARAIPNYSFHIKQFTGKGFICLGDAHRFIDPIFSFGLYLSMREAELAAPVIADYLAGSGSPIGNPFAEHQEHCERGLDVIQELMDAFWDNPLGFALALHKKYTEDIIDIFAGRVYHTGPPSPGLRALQAINEHARKTVCCKTNGHGTPTLPHEGSAL